VGLVGRLPGNPVKRRRGEAVRAVILATVRPDEPMPLAEVLQVLGVSQPTLLRHLATLQERGRIKRYTTAQQVVRVW
jgi:predicted ArsR family transcriptional regulator